MMGIYILEDNVFQNCYIKETIQELCRKNSYRLGAITAASHPKTIIDSCRASAEPASLYFLDIKIKENETAGLLVAKQIRRLEPQAFIAFVTTYAEFALASYEYMTSAFAYIVKTADTADFQEKIKGCLDTYEHYLATQTPVEYFSYQDRFTNLKVPFADLFYVATVSPHKIMVKSKNKEHYFHGALKDIASADPRLVQCHQSFLVNLDSAQLIDKSKRLLYFTDDITAPIARKSMKQVLNAWNERILEVSVQ